MTRVISALLLVPGALLPSAFALPQQHFNSPVRTPHKYPRAENRAQGVIDAFRFSWEGYYKYAFPNDELHPVSNTFSNSRNGWGASAVDALTTAIVMQQKDIVNQIIDYIPKINYANTSSEVSLFETTIRYLGGMLSGYDFLNGPLANLTDNKDNVAALLKQSENLANILSYAFETPTGIPYNGLTITSRSVDGAPNGLATTGTLILEWQRLSDLSGNSTYGSLAQKAESYLLNPKPASSEPWPGLLGTNINVTTGEFLDAQGGWVGGDDSFYEYLIKMWVYDPSRFSQYKDRWILAADSTIQHLTSHPSSRPDLTFVAMFNGRNLSLVSEHLACFDGGNFILGGTVLGNQSYIDYGLKLVDGCHDTYTSTATGIGPEIFAWDATRVPADQAAFYNKSGFYIQDASYNLRPEVIESYYYAYRATGDTKYQDWAWEAFLNINSTTIAQSGYTSVDNVNVVGGGNKQDFQESFWFAEVMKYSYLIQAPDAEWQVSKDGKNKWVFNTEAHPMKVKGS